MLAESRRSAAGKVMLLACLRYGSYEEVFIGVEGDVCDDRVGFTKTHFLSHLFKLFNPFPLSLRRRTVTWENQGQRLVRRERILSEDQIDSHLVDWARIGVDDGHLWRFPPAKSCYLRLSAEEIERYLILTTLRL